MIQTTHLKPSAIGEEITATATLEEVDGRKLTFSITAHDSKGQPWAKLPISATLLTASGF